MPYQKRSIWSWALYDFGNSAFATVIMAGYFPVFFKTYWSSGADTTVSTAQLGIANALAGLFIGLLAPLLGAIADRGCSKKKFLIFFAYAGALMSMALCFIQKGQWQYAAAMYVFAVIGFSGANVFYDALLPAVAGKKNIDYVSALGFATGYLGGGMLLAISVWMTMSPAAFGIEDSTSAIRLSFLFVGIWWGFFTLPLMLFVREVKTPGLKQSVKPIHNGFKQLWRTFSEVRQMKMVFLFLIAYWLYIDGVNTIIRMAVDYGMSIGLQYRDLLLALLITQFIAFPCALFFGKLGEKIGPKKAIYIAMALYLFVIIWGVMMTKSREFYALACMVGLVQGGIQAMSRSYYCRLIPGGKSAEFFGFYNMIGKFAVVFGPALMAFVTHFTQSHRIGIASVALFFLLGGALLFFVDERVDEKI